MPATEINRAKKRVGILRGGPGEEYAMSLKRGGEIIAHIFENLGEKYKVMDILVDSDGIWHLAGVPILSNDLPHKVDVVWNVSHPSFSNILNSFAIPNVTRTPFSWALSNSRSSLRQHLKQADIDMPRHIVLPVYQKDFDGPRERYAIKAAKEVHSKFGAPWIVKSFTPDSNMGIHLAKTFPELVAAIEDGVNHDKSILVEEFILGKVAAVHSLPGFRGEDDYTFPLGNTYGLFSNEEKYRLATIAQTLHGYLGTKHYLKMNFILSPRGKVYLTEIESIPDLKPGSHFAEVCESVGAKLHHVVEHILENAS